MDIKASLFCEEAMNNEWAGKALNLGRCGEFDAEAMRAKVERMWRWPRAYLIKDVCLTQNGSFALSRVELASHSDPQHGKSGYRVFDLSHLAKGSIIEFTDVQGTSKRFFTIQVFLQDGMCARLDRFPQPTQHEVYRQLFPSGYAKFLENQDRRKQVTALATRLSQLIEEDRQKVRADEELEIDGLKASARFKDYDPERLAQSILSERGDTEDSVVILQSMPTHFIVENPFAKAATAREAIDAAQAELVRRRKAQEAAAQQASDAGLPALKGTERQVACAVQIRAKLLAKQPNDRRLKTATTARYWIENCHAI